MSVKQKTISGILWNGGGKFISQGLSIFFTIFLARLLNPEAFGLIALITVFSGISMLFIDFGFSSALIQNGSKDGLLWDSIFWLNITVGLICCLLMQVFAPFIASFFGSTELILLASALGWVFVINSLGLLQKTQLRSNLEFNKINIVELCAQVLSSSTAVWAAYNGFSYWSLMIQIMLQASLCTVGYWICSGWRPKFNFSWLSASETFGYTIPLMGTKLIGYFSRNTDNILIAKILGDSALGAYSQAYKIMLRPLKNISDVFSSVLFPAFSALQDRPDKIKSSFILSIKMIGFITIPLMGFVSLKSETIILVLLGPQWSLTATILTILAPLGAFQSLSTLTGSVFLALGKTKEHFKIGGIANLGMVLFIVIGLYWDGIMGLCWMYLFSSVFMGLFIFHYMGKLIDLSVGEVLISIEPYVSSTLITLFIVWLCDVFLISGMNDILNLLFLFLISFAIYISILELRGKNLLQSIYSLVRNGK